MKTFVDSSPADGDTLSAFLIEKATEVKLVFLASRP